MGLLDKLSSKLEPDTKHAPTSEESSGPPPPSYDEATGPQIALNTDFISKQPLSLQAQGHATSGDFVINDGNGNRLFEVEAATISASHSMDVMHSPSQQHLFTIQKHIFSMGCKYSAEMPPEGSGVLLFETETSPGFFSGGTTYMTFLNAATGQQDQLEVELHATSECIVRYQGKHIADIDRSTMWSTTLTINIHIAGVDPLLLVVLGLVINDRAKTNARRRQNNLNRGF